MPSSPVLRTSSTFTTVAAGARGSSRVPVRPALCLSAPASGRARPLLPLPAFDFLSSLEEDLLPLPWVSLEELRALLSILRGGHAPEARCWQSRSPNFLSSWGATQDLKDLAARREVRRAGPEVALPTPNPTAVPWRVWVEPADRVRCSQRTWVGDSWCQCTGLL